MTIEVFEIKKLTCTNDGVFHTIQGEGKYCGVPSVFLRLSTCNLKCEWSNGDGTYTKCDTPYSSFNPEVNVATIQSLLDVILSYPCHHVVITGGEPMLQPNVDLLVAALGAKKKFVTIETNGTIFRAENKAQFFSISPKLASSCHHNSPDFERHHTSRLNFLSLANLCKRSHQLKFVVQRKDDLQEIEMMVRQIAAMNGGYDCQNVWLMPQGIDAEQFDKKLPWIIDEAKKRNWNVSDRFHIRIWKHVRRV